jgi:hypothetical protein
LTSSCALHNPRWHLLGMPQRVGHHAQGLPWQYTWGWGCFSGVARDALYLAEQIDAALHGQVSILGVVGAQQHPGQPGQHDHRHGNAQAEVQG